MLGRDQAVHRTTPKVNAVVTARRPCRRFVQKSECFCCNRVKYWRLWTRHAATAGKLLSDSGPVRRAAVSIDLNTRLALRHSSSNHIVDGLRRHMTWRTGICLSSSPAIDSVVAELSERVTVQVLVLPFITQRWHLQVGYEHVQTEGPP